jgi:hypothetical protein
MRETRLPVAKVLPTKENTRHDTCARTQGSVAETTLAVAPSVIRRLSNDNVLTIFDRLHKREPPPPEVPFVIGFYVLLRPDKKSSNKKIKSRNPLVLRIV